MHSPSTVEPQQWWSWRTGGAYCSKPALIHILSPFLCLSLPSDAVPEELAEPLYRDQYNQEHLKPPVACLLQSAELYCRAGSLILRSDAVKPLLGHNAVIQALAQKGLYVTDQDRLVTERDLTSTPIHMVSGDVPDGAHD